MPQAILFHPWQVQFAVRTAQTDETGLTGNPTGEVHPDWLDDPEIYPITLGYHVEALSQPTCLLQLRIMLKFVHHVRLLQVGTPSNQLCVALVAVP
eukprot:6462897-Amphidinium_carterae.1